MNTFIEILILFLFILMNGFLAMSELAVVSARKARLRLRAAEGRPGYQAALELAENPGRFLSTVQIGITTVAILTGAFGGATLAKHLADLFTRLGLDPATSDIISVLLVVTLITYFSLIIGELAPKQIALLNPERVAAAVARPMKILSRITAPLVKFLSWSTSLVLGILRIEAAQEPSVSEEEIKLLVGQGAEIGILTPIEEVIVDQVFRLSDMTVESLTTPRTEVVWLDIADPPSESIQKIKASQYMYFPVAQNNLDNLLGFVKATDLLAQSLEEGTIDLHAALLEPLFVPENAPAYSLLERFRETGYEIAIVIGEYGGFQGLVTLRDLLEALVGDLPEAAGRRDPDIVRREDGTHLLDGLIPIEGFRDLFNLKQLPGEGENYYQSLGGFMVYMLDRIPTEGDNVFWEGYRLEVVDMDGKRVDKILVTLLEENKNNS
ncbi:MAG: hemolysin family protein [Anaerolineales bacterium]|nr:hemolysin family protein [Anaerolineales bacterium]